MAGYSRSSGPRLSIRSRSAGSRSSPDGSGLFHFVQNGLQHAFKGRRLRRRRRVATRVGLIGFRPAVMMAVVNAARTLRLPARFKCRDVAIARSLREFARQFVEGLSIRAGGVTSRCLELRRNLRGERFKFGGIAL